MFVTTIKSRQKGKVYETHLVRRTFREKGKVKTETLANITQLPPDVRDLVRRSLRGERCGPSSAQEIVSSRAHGHVALIRGVIGDVGLRSALRPKRCRERQLVEAMIVARILAPQSKLATTRWWRTTTLPEELEVEDATEDELYAALDWLAERQPRIEQRLARECLEDGALVLYDISSSYVTGQCCALAAHGHSRDHRPDKPQVVYGVITNGAGCPVSVEVFAGNTSDTTTVMDQVHKVRDRFGLERLILVGDRGMIKQTRIDELRKVEGVDWISALDTAQIRALVDGGELQLGLFDQRNLMEITSQQFPGERLVVCRNPLLAEERSRKREELLQVTEQRLRSIARAVAAGRLKKGVAIAERVGRAWGNQRMRKHFRTETRDGVFQFERDEKGIAREASLDGFYVIRTSVEDAQSHPADQIVRCYKRLSKIEHVFRNMKTTQLLVRPIYHYDEQRVRAHIFLCMLAAHVLWHLEQRLAGLLFHDPDRDELKRTGDPVAPKPRSQEGVRKDTQQTSADGLPAAQPQDPTGRDGDATNATRCESPTSKGRRSGTSCRFPANTSAGCSRPPASGCCKQSPAPLNWRKR